MQEYKAWLSYIANTVIAQMCFTGLALCQISEKSANAGRVFQSLEWGLCASTGKSEKVLALAYPHSNDSRTSWQAGISGFALTTIGNIGLRSGFILSRYAGTNFYGEKAYPLLVSEESTHWIGVPLDAVILFPAKSKNKFYIAIGGQVNYLTSSSAEIALDPNGVGGGVPRLYDQTKYYDPRTYVFLNAAFGRTLGLGAASQVHLEISYIQSGTISNNWGYTHFFASSGLQNTHYRLSGFSFTARYYFITL